MGWIIALICLVLFIVVMRKVLDRETTRNMKYLGKMFAAVAGLIVLLAILSFTGH